MRLTQEREREIRAELKIVISHIEADMAADLMEEIDDLRDEIKRLREPAQYLYPQSNGDEA